MACRPPPDECSTAGPPAWVCSASSTTAATNRSSDCGTTSTNRASETPYSGSYSDRSGAFDGREHREKPAGIGLRFLDTTEVHPLPGGVGGPSALFSAA